MGKPKISATALIREKSRLMEDLAMLVSRFEERTGERVTGISIQHYRRVDVDDQPWEFGLTVETQASE